MADAMRENGVKTTWRALVSTTGVMVECTLGSTSMIRNMDMASIAGKTAESTKDFGISASSMVSVYTQSQGMPQSPNLDCGRMAKESNGSLKRHKRKST